MADPMPETAIGATSLEIVVPADPRLLRVLRLVASGVASLGALSLDGVEEVRVAVDELGATLIGASAGAPVTVRFELDATSICVEGSTELGDSSPLKVDPLTDRILDAVATSHEWSTDGSTARCRIEKQLVTTP
jgi:hypothetical protein